MKKVLILSAVLIAITLGSKAQTSSTRGSETATAQPRIMVIPYTKADQDIRTIMESDPVIRIATTAIKEAFDARGFTTVDFAARLKSANTSDIVNKADGAQTDIKTAIIQNSGADMYVEAEIIPTKNPQVGNSVKLVLTAYETSTGNSLANKVGDSGTWRSEDYAKMATGAMNSIADDFMTVLQDKFTDIVENGRSIQIEFALNANSDMDMYSEVGTDGYALSDVIEMWLGENAYKSSYHIQGVSDKKMIIDEVKIPLRDQNTGSNYTTTRFAAEVSKMLRGLNLEADRFVQNQKIIFTIK